MKSELNRQQFEWRQRRPEYGRNHPPLDQKQLERSLQRPFKRDIVIFWPPSPAVPCYYVREECQASTELKHGGARFVYTPIERWNMGKPPIVNMVNDKSFKDFVEPTTPRPSKALQTPPAPAREVQLRVVRRQDGAVTFFSTAIQDGKRKKEEEEEERAPSPPMTRSRGRLGRKPPVPPTDRVTRSQKL